MAHSPKELCELGERGRKGRGGKKEEGKERGRERGRNNKISTSKSLVTKEPRLFS